MIAATFIRVEWIMLGIMLVLGSFQLYELLIDMPYTYIIRKGSERYQRDLRQPQYRLNSPANATRRAQYRCHSVASKLHRLHMNRLANQADRLWRLPHWKRP